MEKNPHPIPAISWPHFHRLDFPLLPFPFPQEPWVQGYEVRGTTEGDFLAINVTPNQRYVLDTTGKPERFEPGVSGYICSTFVSQHSADHHAFMERVDRLRATEKAVEDFSARIKKE